VERKASLADTEKIRQAICAFANDLADHREPGVVFVGANDDGSCSNCRIDDALLQNLASMRSDGNIVPFPTMTVQKWVHDGCEMAVATVHPSYFPPVRYHGRTWIRVGPRRGIATVEEELRLTEKRRAGDLTFDLHPVPDAGTDDLDLTQFERLYLPAAIAPDVLERNGRSVQQQLASLRFLTREGLPTVVGMLVLGRDPTRFVPCAYIQFLRIEGTTLTDPIKDQRQISGPLPDVLRMLDETLAVNLSVRSDPTAGTTELRHPDYPLVALQQLTRNAVLHRRYEGTAAPVRISWFSDRIEVLSPGGPYGQVTRDNFGRPGVTDYRNPHLAEAMKVLGYVQRFGIGIELARKDLHQNGNPPPEFGVEDTHVLAVVRRSR
jgi:ATP-dependent DNA helicase RecG